MSSRCASSRQFITSQFQVHRWVPAASWSAKPFSSAANMALSFASRGRWRDIAGGQDAFPGSRQCYMFISSCFWRSLAHSTQPWSQVRSSRFLSKLIVPAQPGDFLPQAPRCGHRALRLCVAWTALSPVPLHFGGRFLPSPSLGNPRSSLAF